MTLSDDQYGHVIGEFLTEHEATSDQLLPLLHHVQAAFGCITASAIEHVSQILNLSHAEVFGVVSFYEDFTTESTKSSVDICVAEACQAVGCQTLFEDLEALLDKGGVPLRKVYCLGNCAVGPSVRVGNRIFGRATPTIVMNAIELAGDSVDSQAEKG